MEPIVELESVSKFFPRGNLRATSFKETIFNWVKGERQRAEPFYALRDISFQVKSGEAVGIIGSNGSGKSTLLKLLCGIIKPSSGTIRVRGRIAPLLELGAGFHPDFTGRENVYLNASFLGISRKRVQALFDEIVAFAELEDFIDSPVKTYSSGMYMRLAFATAVHVDPEIILIDEVLAVGDPAFQVKCRDKIANFKEMGKTIFIVSHNHQSIQDICDRAIWIEKGVQRSVGSALDIVAKVEKGTVSK